MDAEHNANKQEEGRCCFSWQWKHEETEERITKRANSNKGGSKSTSLHWNMSHLYCRNNWPFAKPHPRTTTVESYINNHNYAWVALPRFQEKVIYQSGVLTVPANLAANTKKEERCWIWIKQCGTPREQLKPSKINRKTFVCSCCYWLPEKLNVSFDVYI